MNAQPEVWRVSTIEGIFETDLETLKQWIGEGCVLPTDKVSKGNLSWIEAGRVPKLKGAFSGEPAPALAPNISFESFAASNAEPTTPPINSTPAPQVLSQSHAHACHNHPESAPEYVCRMCGALLCKRCPKFAGGKVPMCPLCGDLCHEYRAVTEKSARAAFQSSGFGMEDFGRAICYPMQHKVALISGALIYGFLTLAGLRGTVVAWVILFGCISHVISQVAWGRLHRSFMPDFSTFSLWDDLVLPIFLGIGIMIVSFGPMVVLVFALVFGMVSGRGESAHAPHEAQPFEAVSPEDPSETTGPNVESRSSAQIANDAEASRAESSDPTGFMKYVRGNSGATMTIGILVLLCGIWGLFYYPMALTVAGYTQSVGSVLNPLVGLDTILRMGATYFKGFAMVVVIQILSYLLAGMTSVITSPFALPFMGNVVGNFITATFTFYFNLVIACILGLSLFKCADRLGIAVD